MFRPCPHDASAPYPLGTVQIRDDKQPEDATNARQIATLFEEQDSRKVSTDRFVYYHGNSSYA